MDFFSQFCSKHSPEIVFSVLPIFMQPLLTFVASQSIIFLFLKIVNKIAAFLLSNGNIRIDNVKQKKRQ